MEVADSDSKSSQTSPGLFLNLFLNPASLFWLASRLPLSPLSILLKKAEHQGIYAQRSFLIKELSCQEAISGTHGTTSLFRVPAV
jgi:hypothetical protein